MSKRYIADYDQKYSSQNVKKMESAIDERLVDWFRRVDEQSASEPGKACAFDIGRRIQYLTVDIITKLALGKELGCVETDSDKFDYLATVQQGNAFCQHCSVILELSTLLFYLTKIPILGPMMIPKAQDKSGVGRIMGVSEDDGKSFGHSKLTWVQVVREATETRKWAQSKGNSAFVDLLLENGLPESQIETEMVVALSAGSSFCESPSGG